MLGAESPFGVFSVGYAATGQGLHGDQEYAAGHVNLFRRVIHPKISFTIQRLG